jgi:hypothetical protein
MPDARFSAPGARIGRAVIGLVWAALVAVCGAIVLEALLALRERSGAAAESAPAASGRPRYDRLHAAYLPFAIQHLHPIYLCFFPLDPAQRAALSNEVVHLDGEGFRGGGPEQAGGRALGFLLGGSTAFGHFASSDAATITGHLNALQPDAFVVNADVPSWNSTQELARLTHQILAYQPALIVSFDGANEVGILAQYHALGLEEPPGTPENFDLLQALVDDIRQPNRVRGRVADRLFPHLASALRGRPLHRRGASLGRGQPHGRAGDPRGARRLLTPRPRLQRVPIVVTVRACPIRPPAERA